MILEVVSWFAVDVALKNSSMKQKTSDSVLSLFHALFGAFMGYYLYNSENAFNKPLVAGLTIGLVTGGYFVYDIVKVLKDIYDQGLTNPLLVYLIHHLFSWFMITQITNPVYVILNIKAYAYGEFSNIFLNMATIYASEIGTLPPWLLVIEIIGYGIPRVIGIGSLLPTLYSTFPFSIICGGTLLYLLGVYWTSRLCLQLNRKLKRKRKIIYLS